MPLLAGKRWLEKDTAVRKARVLHLKHASQRSAEVPQHALLDLHDDLLHSLPYTSNGNSSQTAQCNPAKVCGRGAHMLHAQHARQRGAVVPRHMLLQVHRAHAALHQRALAVVARARRSWPRKRRAAPPPATRPGDARVLLPHSARLRACGLDFM